MRERWKAPRKGDEIVSETVYLQGVEGHILRSQECGMANRVPIEEWSNELILCGLIKS